MYSIKREPNYLAVVSSLDSRIFYGEEMDGAYIDSSVWWVARTAKGHPVAFAGAKLLDDGKTLYLSRAGVLEEHRGNGLQKRLIKSRLAYARKSGCNCVITYTVPCNFASSNSLIACGFTLYNPEYPWVGKPGYEILYWRKML